MNREQRTQVLPSATAAMRIAEYAIRSVFAFVFVVPAFVLTLFITRVLFLDESYSGNTTICYFITAFTVVAVAFYVAPSPPLPFTAVCYVIGACFAILWFDTDPTSSMFTAGSAVSLAWTLTGGFIPLCACILAAVRGRRLTRGSSGRSAARPATEPQDR